MVFDHRLGKTWIVSTGSGRRWPDRSSAQMGSSFGSTALRKVPPAKSIVWRLEARESTRSCLRLSSGDSRAVNPPPHREEFLHARRATRIKLHRAGDIYQVNLSHRLRHAPFLALRLGNLFQNLSKFLLRPIPPTSTVAIFRLTSSSPEFSFRLSGAHIQSRPIKGTRPRSSDPTRDPNSPMNSRPATKKWPNW